MPANFDPDLVGQDTSNIEETADDKILQESLALEKGRADHYAHINDRLKQQNLDSEANRNLRRNMAWSVFVFMCVYFITVFGIVILVGFNIWGFHLDVVPLTTLIGGTFVSAIGLVAIVARGLFRVERAERRRQSE